MKESDIDELCDTRGTYDCRKCTEYDECDNCSRRTCVYVAVDRGDDLWCRECCRDVGISEQDIKSQKVDYV